MKTFKQHGGMVYSTDWNAVEGGSPLDAAGTTALGGVLPRKTPMLKTTRMWFLTTIAIVAVITLAGCGNPTPDKTFTVTFDADNGSTPATQTVPEGGKATKPANPVKADHHFVHWYNTATTAEWDFNTAITANINLKAQWNPANPIEHTDTITAYGRTINIRGDASISPADFANAKGKLEAGIAMWDSWFSNDSPEVFKFIAIVERTGFEILIQTGNAPPDADANKSMIIGVDYLLSPVYDERITNDAEAIGVAIYIKVVEEDAFADDPPPHTHAYQWEVTSQGSQTEDRIETETCTVCGATNGTRIVPFFRTAQIEDLFGEGYTATVQGTLILEQWTGLDTRIITALNAAFNDGTGPQGSANKGRFRNVFADGDVVIIVESDPEYNNYKVIGTGGIGYVKTLYLNVNSTLEITDIKNAISAMVTGSSAIDVYPTP